MDGVCALLQQEDVAAATARALFEASPSEADPEHRAFQAALGDTLDALAYRDALQAMGSSGGTVPRWAESVAADVDARLAVRRGDDVMALDAAQRAYDLWVIHDANQGGWYPEPGIRFHLARRLEAAGRGDDALWLYRSFLRPHWASFYTVLAREAVPALEVTSPSPGS